MRSGSPSELTKTKTFHILLFCLSHHVVLPVVHGKQLSLLCYHCILAKAADLHNVHE